ncbi:MAG: hypothetical protein AAF533_28175 [Acidobacteriota bacterium]
MTSSRFLSILVVTATCLTSSAIAARPGFGDRRVDSRVAEKLWPLPVPSPRYLSDPSELQGVLVHFDWGDVQVDEASLQVSPSGDLVFASFRGHDRDGNLIVHEPRRPRGRTVTSLGALTNLRIGHPERPESLVDVDHLALGVGSDGFLRIVELTGQRIESGLHVHSDDDPGANTPCGIKTVFGCRRHECLVDSCGAYPGCACNSTNRTSGNCQGYTDQECKGTCPVGSDLTCFNNGRCGCHSVQAETP